MSILVLCPSRGRPDAAKELLASFEATKTAADSHLVFLVDRDDRTQDYYPGSNLRIVEPAGGPVPPSNAAALASDDDIIGWTGDDSRFQTPGWDGVVRRDLREPGVFWGWDGHDKPWPSTFFVSREIVRALGYLIPPTLQRTYWDTCWVYLAANSGTARESTAVTFLHDNSASASPKQDILDADKRAFDEWMRNSIVADARKVRTAYELAHFFPPELIHV